MAYDTVIVQAGPQPILSVAVQHVSCFGTNDGMITPSATAGTTPYQFSINGGTTWQKGKRHPTLGNNVVIGAGAKILGPITLADNVRVGSNSVVVKSIEADKTVVGVPGRVLKDNNIKSETFESYAVSSDADDPTIKAINSILSHLHDIDSQLHKVSKELNLTEKKDSSVNDLEIESK
jgi:serine O-acetyltransferase